MRKKTLEKFGRKIDVYEDGRIYAEAYKNSYGRNIKGKFLNPCQNDQGYWLVRFGAPNVKNKLFRVHRLLAEAFIESFTEDSEVDYKNGDKSDNRLENLRCGTHKANMMGCWKTNKWVAKIGTHKIRTHIGLYLTEDESTLAYNTKAIELGFQPEALNKI